MVYYHSNCEFICKDVNKNYFKSAFEFIDTNFTAEFLSLFTHDYMYTERLNKTLFLTVCVHNCNLYMAVYSTDLLVNFIKDDMAITSKILRDLKILYKRFCWELEYQVYSTDKLLVKKWESFLYNFDTYISILIKRLSPNNVISLSQLPTELLQKRYVYDIMVYVKKLTNR